MGKVVPGVQRVIPKELEHISVPGIAPGTRGNADNRAGRKTVLGIEIVRDHLKFLGRVRIRERHGEVRIVVHVVSAVEHVIRATLTAAIYGGSAFARERRVVLSGKGDSLQPVGRSRREKYQSRGVAAVQRQIDDGFLVDGLPQLAVDRVERFRRRRHLNRLVDLANFQGKIHGRQLADGQRDVRVNFRGESRMAAAQDVGSGGYQRKRISPLIRCGGADLSGCGFFSGDDGAIDRRAALIAYGSVKACQTTPARLAAEWKAGENEKQNRQEPSPGCIPTWSTQRTWLCVLHGTTS